MRDWDIIVTGGGPSGLQFAREIGKRTDYSVAVLERNTELRENDKSTGGTFHQVIDGFDIPDHVIMGDSPDVIFEGPTESATLHIPNYVLDFPAFLEFLGEDAAANGVSIRTGVDVLEPIVTDGVVTGVRARENGEEVTYTARLTVDASGAAGVLTSQLDMWDPDHGQEGIGKEYEATGRFDEDAMVFKFDHQYAPGGYAWVFPGEDNTFKIGVCWVNDFYDQNHDPVNGQTIDEYLDSWIESDDRWEIDEIEEVHAGRVISDNSINTRVNDGVIAVGDTVSSINPLFGEGIRPGMESARMAATTAINALDQDTVTRSALRPYETQWNTEKGSAWKLQRIMGELLYDFTPSQQDAFVRRTQALSNEQATRLQQYDLTLRDLLQLYPVRIKDIRKTPTLLRHVT